SAGVRLDPNPLTVMLTESAPSLRPASRPNPVAKASPSKPTWPETIGTVWPDSPSFSSASEIKPDLTKKERPPYSSLLSRRDSPGTPHSRMKSQVARTITSYQRVNGPNLKFNPALRTSTRSTEVGTATNGQANPQPKLPLSRSPNP